MEDVEHLPDILQHYQVQWKDASDGESDRTGDLVDDSKRAFEISEDFEHIKDENVTSESRISEILRGWMPNYTVQSIQPFTNPDKELLYSAKLGKEPRIKRVSSTESLVTQLSLLSCSTYGKKQEESDKMQRKRKTKGSRPQTRNSSSGSKWVALANRRYGMFDKMLRQQNPGTPGLGGGTDNIVFDMMDEDEKKMLFKCGLEAGVKMARGLKKSESSTNIAMNKQSHTRRFSQAAIGSRNGKLTEFTEFHKLTKQQQLNFNNNRSLTNSKQSLNALDQTKQSLDKQNSNAVMFDTPTIRTVTPPFKEKVRMWQIDDQILDVDLNRGLSAKVKDRINSTALALERVSRRQGDARPKTTPGCIRTNPNNPQNIRISPELSSVIQQDIKFRMGQPRYHEIRKKDVQIWDRGQELDRSHRNLKVFNWLHSLQEDEFDSKVEQDMIIDDVSAVENGFVGVVYVHVEAVDEPKCKPITYDRYYRREQTIT